MDVEVTSGKLWDEPGKYLVAGQSGSGLSTFASTAPEPLFVFFRENPRIRSLQGRAVPYLRLFNLFEHDGSIKRLAHERLARLHTWLTVNPNHQYETLVIDTADNLFQAMRLGRRARNRGEWGNNDWNWLSDTYREVVQGIVDLPMRVIWLCHTKAGYAEDANPRELALQGQMQSDMPEFFDVVAALDVWEVIEDDGSSETKRCLITHTDAKYSWVKEPTGKLPRFFQVNLLDDVRRLEKALSDGAETPINLEPRVAEAIEEEGIDEEIETTPELSEEEDDDTIPVSPEELAGIKATQERGEPTLIVGDTIPVEEVQAPSLEPALEEATETVQTELTVAGVEFLTADQVAAVGLDGGKPTVEEMDQRTAEHMEAVGGSVPEQVSSAKTEDLTDLEAELVKEVEQAADKSDVPVNACSVCGNIVEEESVVDLSNLRFRKTLCREHFKEHLMETRAAR